MRYESKSHSRKFYRSDEKNLKLEKNREESYSHHAVDAMLICYSQMGYDAYRKLQDNVIDWETGEIIDEANFEKSFRQLL